MLIIYPVNTVFPSPRANTIQIMNTAAALSRDGHSVHLIGKKGTADPTEIYRYYGIPENPLLMFHLVPSPRFLSGTRGHESLVMKRTLQVLSFYRNQPKILFTRDPLFASVFGKMAKLFR